MQGLSKDRLVAQTMSIGKEWLDVRCEPEHIMERFTN